MWAEQFELWPWLQIPVPTGALQTTSMRVGGQAREWMAVVNWRIGDPLKEDVGIGSSSLLSRSNKGLQWPDPDFSQEAKNTDFKCWQLIQSIKKKHLFGANKTFAWWFYPRGHQFANLNWIISDVHPAFTFSESLCHRPGPVCLSECRVQMRVF